ncbi:Peptidase A1 domain-containing protein [Aphelenchoides besseyi]|nr:Peptidase A1 domain-containing protein [Aphelenchoides besseyi]
MEIILFSIFLIATTGLVVSKDENSHLIIGRKYHHNGAQLQSYHERKRSEAARNGKLYDPLYPEDPLSGYFYLGESEQLFYIALETGRSDCWVLDKSYPKIGRFIQTFDYDNLNNSAVHVGEFFSHTGEFGLYGEAYSDIIKVFYPANQTFGSVTGTYGDFYDPLFDDFISGALGLSYNPALKDEPITADSAPVLNILNTLPDRPRIYSLAVGANDTSGRMSWAVITFGKNLDELCDFNSLATIPLTFDVILDTLIFQLDSFAIGDKLIDGDLAVVDSGLSIILVPWKTFDIIYSTIRPDFDYQTGVYTTDCSNRSKLDDFVFTVGGVELRIPSTDYVVDLDLESGKCVVKFSVTNAFTAPYALGTPFLYQYCTTWSVEDTTISFKNYLPDTSVAEFAKEHDA